LQARSACRRRSAGVPWRKWLHRGSPDGAPLNGIWDGSGNVICLDVIRSMLRQPDSLDAFVDEIAKGRGATSRFDRFADEVESRLANSRQLEPTARRIVEMMALALQGSLLVRYAAPSVVDAFCATRLDRDWGHAFGTLPDGLDVEAIIERALIEI